MKINISSIVSIISVICIGIIMNIPFVHADIIGEYNEEISSKKDEIDAIKNKVEIYENKIKETQSLTFSLKNQISILENQIAKNGLDIELTEQQIQSANLEIQKTNAEITVTEDKMSRQKGQIGEIVRSIHKNDQVPFLKILLVNNTLSDFYDHYKYLQEIQNTLQNSVNKLKSFKADLQLQKSVLEDKKEQEETLKDELDNKKQDMEEKLENKDILLFETNRSERNFQSYVTQLKNEQRQQNADIITLEKKIREELSKRDAQERFLEFGSARLGWPTDGRYVTSYFHDPDYPYRYIFEHPAIDIRKAQATPVVAAEAGYVARAKNGGAKGYSYVMLIHNDGLSTVYGHVSQLLVSADEFVTKGQTIALSGGRPGTPGAGRLTSGPHLHFEVRLNGIPINPLEYLPRDW